jgi:hypothetical protein
MIRREISKMIRSEDVWRGGGENVSEDNYLTQQIILRRAPSISKLVELLERKKCMGITSRR